MGQQILVQFDDNVRSDGFTPSTKYAWTDPASRRAQTYVQLIGNLQSELSAGSIGDWTNSSPEFQLNDAAADGDTAAGDGIFARSFFNPLAADSNHQFKIIGLEGSFDFQYGQENNGLTFGGSPPDQNMTLTVGVNPLFVVDTVTGRVAINPAGAPFRAASIDAIAPAPNAVTNWALYY